MRDTAAEHAVEPLIRYRQRWSARTGTATPVLDPGGARRGDREKVSYRARFLLMCAGYYRYDHGLPAGLSRPRGLFR
jgi:hypothetical protein